MSDPEQSSDPGSRAGQADESFTCDVHANGRAAIWVRAGGDLDDENAARLERALTEALDDARLVVLDLRALTSINPAGGDAIDRAAAGAQGRGRRVVIVRGPAQIDRFFTATGLAARLEMIDLRAVMAAVLHQGSSAQP